jgi:transcription initiation factor TFIIH subunit 3
MNGEKYREADNGSFHANKYRPFLVVEEQLTRNLKELFATTTPDEVRISNSTMMAGALTLALSYINRESIAYADTHGVAKPDTSLSSHNPTSATSDLPPPPGIDAAPTATARLGTTGLQSRILIISVSSSTDSAHQYIPIMNSIFACQRLHIPIDICKLAGDAVFLQQASDATRGVYIPLAHAAGFLQYLMLAFLPDQQSRRHLVLPTRVDVDFRAACFCHRKIVDVGFVCSICLSIFCDPPEGADCLTCGTHLSLGNYGAKPVVARKKGKRKKAGSAAVRGGVNGNGGGSSGTATPT